MRGKPIEPGCLALVVRSSTSPENVGKVVKVLRRREDAYKGVFGTIHNGSAVAWVVRRESADLLVAACLVDLATGKVVIARLQTALVAERSFADECLMRLDDEPEAEDTTTAVDNSTHITSGSLT